MEKLTALSGAFSDFEAGDDRMDDRTEKIEAGTSCDSDFNRLSAVILDQRGGSQIPESRPPRSSKWGGGRGGKSSRWSRHKFPTTRIRPNWPINTCSFCDGAESEARKRADRDSNVVESDPTVVRRAAERDQATKSVQSWACKGRIPYLPQDRAVRSWREQEQLLLQSS